MKQFVSVKNAVLQKFTQRMVLAALFALCLTFLSATSYADTANQPGCAPDVWQAQVNHAEANRVRDKAYARQTVKENDNTLGMTCYDHALALSSRLGQIFSDKYPEGGFAPADTNAFGTVYDSSSGVGTNTGTGKNKALGSNYGYVLNDELKNHASAFTDSMSAFLGATALGFLDTFTSMFDTLAGAINIVISQIDGYINDLANAIDTIETYLDLVGAALPAAVPFIVSMIQSYWSMIKSTINSAVTAAQNAVMSAVNAIKSQVMGALGSMFGGLFNDADKGECSRVKQLWNPSAGGVIGSLGTAIMGAAGLDGFRSMVGGGTEHGTPYFNFKDLVNKTMTGAGKDLKMEINNSTNSPILSAALADISGGGVLSAPKAPGGGVFWTSVPNLSGMDVDTIISKM